MKSEPVVIGLCGSSGSGKTLTCQKLIQELRSANIACCGFISPAFFEETKKSAIKVQWLESGEERTMLIPATETSQHTIGRWQILPEVFEWISQKLEDMQGCQAFFCDEIGPLEVLQAKGWIKALDIVDERRCEINVITFRPSLKEYFCQRYPAMILYDLEIAGDDVKIVKDVKHLIGID